ncbi:NFACT family protein [Flavonifractor sp. DFI.6.63]|uniref:Rqc2 homolog RqcH n=1 Tax=Lawsonibacter hominis TaxID=2763053 RepID=A0A8J6J3M0_9FIRM|nr:MULTISPECIES: NFACT RNA binding domain-containing protein [Oscillospiraceae]MBC5732116.1 NFACT family protein [Lawsonibacter hominis]MBS1383364.1 fibronectin/fibrinogen-binding protein [Flavonifractor sp.]MCI6397446.1 NFACT family protein [Lawsonibacter sp.]MCQ5028265.1 NFACT family protein [Flavonifractor sp. DFI.6.63]
MPLDALCLTAVAGELRRSLLGGKIDKIYQPAREELLLCIRGRGENVRLLLSANPGHPRAHLTTRNRENPDTPPMFCMLLRKHLLGGRILELKQPPMERLLDFRLETIDELGDRVERRLVLEALGRNSNLILLDGEGRIIDCLRRVDGDMSRQRQVLPGLFYRLPPAPDKLDPMALDGEGLRRALDNPTGREADKLLLDTFNGLSPLIARELAFRAGGDGEPLARELEKLLDAVRREDFAPYLLVREGKGTDVTFLPILQYGPQTESRRQESFSQLLDGFYEEREQMERVRQRGQDLVKSVTSARDRTARKLANQEKELEATETRERQRELGDLLTSNLHAMQKGMSTFRAVDYYDPEGKQTDIPLDPLLTPQQNAAKYYRAYNKAKTARQMLALQMEKGRRELEYLNSVLENISLAEGERDLQEIRQELAETGYLRRPGKAKDRGRKVSGKPMEFRSSAGLRISVGKNNSQNDRLTTKQAYKSDLWLHTQKIHGSHVILWLEGGGADARSLTEAAQLAAYFSQARDGKKVPVDYTPVKYVKKPAGARPGMVVYSTYQTAVVDPDPELAKRLRVK